ncbi:hypothetical protein [Spirosoma telluris]
MWGFFYAHAGNEEMDAGNVLTAYGCFFSLLTPTPTAEQLLNIH